MKKIYILSFLLLSSNLFSQNWINTPDFFTKQCKQSDLDKINSGEIDLNDYTINSRDQKFWKVYADREGVRMKNTYRGSSNNKKLKFMQELYVSEIKANNWLHLFDVNTGEDMGWVNSRYLILSKLSLRSETKSSLDVSIPRKAIVLTSLDELVDGQIDPDDILDQKHYYNDPSPQTGAIIGTPKRFTILFVFKEQDGSVLLAFTDNLDGSGIENSTKVLGWMPKANRTTWSSRACLEPLANENNPHAKGENKWPGYKDISKLNSCINENYCSDDGRFIEFSVGKVHAFRMRYPVLPSENNTSNIKQVVSIAKDVSEDTISGGVVEQMIENLKFLSKHTNIIFAIDATSSMTPYYSSVARSLNEVVNSSKEQNHKVKFGLVIYRDYADGNNAYDYEPLTTDYESFKRKLNNVKCMSKDNDKPEAQYNGLINGLNALNLNPKESNVVVLIGDCGNHKVDEKGLTNKSVTDLFIKKNINLIAFQVASSSNDYSTYAKFNIDAQSYVKNTAQSKIEGKKTDLKYEWKRLKNENTYRLVWKDQSVCNFQNMFGRFIYSSTNSTMSTKILENSIVFSLKEYMSTIDENIRILEDIFNGGTGCGISSDKILDNPPEGVVVYIMNNFKHPNGKSYTRDEAEEYLKRTEVTVKANVAINYLQEGEIPEDISENALRYVVFLTHKELNELKRELKSLISSDCKTISEQKNCFQEQMINVVRNILGPRTSEETIGEFTLSQVWRIVFGVEFANKDLESYKLNNLHDIPRHKFKDFYKEFFETSDMFIDEDYVHSNLFKSRQLIINGDKFYWIPLEDLPGTTIK